MFVATDVGNHGAGRVEQFPCQFCSPGGVPGNVLSSPENVRSTPKYVCSPEKNVLIHPFYMGCPRVVHGLSTGCLRFVYAPFFSEVDIGGSSNQPFFW